MKSIKRVQKIESICIYSAFIKMKKKRKLLKFIRLPPKARRMASSICSLLRPQLVPFSRSSLTSFLKKIPVTLSMTKTCESNTFSLGVNERISMSHYKVENILLCMIAHLRVLPLLLSRVGAVFYDLYRPLVIKFPDCLFRKNIVWCTWNLKWGLQSKCWPLFIFFLAEQTWKFLHKNPSFLPPLPKPNELYWPFLGLLLYVRRSLLSSNMKVSLRGGYQAPSFLVDAWLYTL